MIVLTVQSDGNNGYRLRIKLDDYRNYFQSAQSILTIINRVEMICSVPNERCPELRNASLSEWIRENNFHDYHAGKPTELQFNLLETNGNIVLTYEA